MAALGITILDIVMNEREVMNQLQCRGRRKGGARLPSCRFTGEQAEGGTQGLSRGINILLAMLVYPSEVVSHHAIELKPVRLKYRFELPVQARSISVKYGWYIHQLMFSIFCS
jgi:hypothetical protein